MNKTVFIFSLLLLPNIINAAANNNAEKKDTPVVIRVIEGRKIVSDTVEGKDIESKLMKVRNTLDKEIKTIDQELEKDIADWQGKARLKVDAESLERKQSEIMRKKKERDVKAEAAQEEFTKSFNRELAKFNGRIKETVSQVAQDEGWDIVKIKETGELVYVSPRVDVSDKVVRRHDIKYKAEKAASEKAKQAPAMSPIV